MLDHHIQRTIIYQLAFTHEARFKDLKPDDLDNKLFTYHLKKVIAAGYVQKSEEGLYSLTQDGRRLGTGAVQRQEKLLVERAHSVLFLVIRRMSDGAWLMYKRGTYPMLGFSGFMHCNPDLRRDASEAAQHECNQKTGLSGEFTVLGSGYFRVFEQERLESFTHFTLLYCDDIQGELDPHDNRADYFWVNDPNELGDDMFPSTMLLKDSYEQKRPFFVERTFTI